MLQKKKRVVDKDAPAGKRLCNNIKDLYGAGQISAGRAHSLMADAAESGVDACRYRKLNHDQQPRARDVRQGFLKDSRWPEVLRVPCPIKTRDGALVLEQVSFLVPHEVLAEMLPHADPVLLFSTSGLDCLSKGKLEEVKSTLKVDQLIPVSLWLDAIPFSWERDESVQVFTWGLPGISAEPWKQLRFPFCVLPKAMCAQETIDHVLRVWSWSMASLSVGKWPVRFDVLEDVELQGKVRTKMAGQPLGFWGAMVQMKMDWEALGNLIHFPRWDNASGICHRCHITKGEILQVELTAPWRQPENRILPEDLLAHLVQQGRPISAAWEIPHFDAQCIQLDWLHCADQGVSARFLGSILVYAICRPGLQQFGATQEVRRACVWSMLQTWYKKERVYNDRLKALPLSRFDLQPPKLKAMAGSIRRLIPFFLLFVNQWAGQQPDGLTEEQEWILTGMVALSECYQCLSHKSGKTPEDLKLQSTMFAVSLKALHNMEPARYGVKPKLHQFLELCASGIVPSDVWNYREEDFGGSLASMAKTEGGITTASSCSDTTLSRFCIRQDLPVLCNTAPTSS